MRRLQAASLVLAFVAATGLVLGTAGFSAMTADRGLGVSLADDESAFLGYDTLTDEVHSGESTPVVEYHNQFERDLDSFTVDVSIVDPDDTNVEITCVETPDTLPNGGKRAVDVTLACAEQTEVHLLFEASGSAAGVSVSLDRVHTVTCLPDDGGDEIDEPTVTGVHYDDAANADVSVERADDTVVANVWITDIPPVYDPDAIEAVPFDGNDRLNTSKKVRPEVVQKRSGSGLPSDWKIVAIEFPDQGIAYVHPQWNAGEYDTPKTGDGVAFTDLPLDADTLFNTTVEGDEVVVTD